MNKPDKRPGLAHILNKPMHFKPAWLCADDRSPSSCRVHNSGAGCGSSAFDGASWDVPGHSSNCQCRLKLRKSDFYFIKFDYDHF